MKVFRYIFTKALYSFLGVFLILCAIDFSFNFFSEMEDVNDNYTYQDLIIYLFYCLLKLQFILWQGKNILFLSCS